MGEKREREKNEEIQEELEKTEVEKFRGMVESRRKASKMSEDIVSRLVDEVCKLSANRLDERVKESNNKRMKDDCGPSRKMETNSEQYTAPASSLDESSSIVDDAEDSDVQDDNNSGGGVQDEDQGGGGGGVHGQVGDRADPVSAVGPVRK